MIRVIHRQCGHTAFFVHERLKAGDPIRAANIVLVNGEPAEPYTSCICGHCNEPIRFHLAELDQQHWTDWFIPPEEKDGKTSNCNQERFEDEKR